MADQAAMAEAQTQMFPAEQCAICPQLHLTDHWYCHHPTAGSAVDKSINRATSFMILVHTLCIYIDMPQVCLEQVPISCHAFRCV